MDFREENSLPKRLWRPLPLPSFRGLSQLQAAPVVEYLLLNREFPRAVAYCLSRGLQAVNMISGTGDQSKNQSQYNAIQFNVAMNTPQRSLGRLVADLEYLEVHDILGESLHKYLEQLLWRLNYAGEDIAHMYFSTQVILPELHPQQAQQQQ